MTLATLWALHLLGFYLFVANLPLSTTLLSSFCSSFPLSLGMDN